MAAAVDNGNGTSKLHVAEACGGHNRFSNNGVLPSNDDSMESPPCLGGHSVFKSRVLEALHYRHRHRRHVLSTLYIPAQPTRFLSRDNNLSAISLDHLSVLPRYTRAFN